MSTKATKITAKYKMIEQNQDVVCGIDASIPDIEMQGKIHIGLCR